MPALRTTIAGILLLGGCSFDLDKPWPAGPADAAVEISVADANADADAPPNDGPVVDSTLPGTTLWVRTCGATSHDGGAPAAMSGASVAVDNTGHIYVAGTFTSQGSTTCGGKILTSRGGSEIFVVKLTSQNSVDWAITAGSSGEDAANSLTISPDGQEIYVAGYFTGTAHFGSETITSVGKSDGFVARLNSSTGAFSWVRGVGGLLDDKVEAVTRNTTPNKMKQVVVAGWFKSKYAGFRAPSAKSLGTKIAMTSTAKANTSDILIGGLTPGGAYSFLTGVEGELSDAAEGITAGANGELYVAGYFYSQTLKAGGASPFKADKMSDALLLRVGAKGSLKGGSRLGGQSAEEALGIAMQGDKPVVTGFFRSAKADFGSTELHSFGGKDDLFVTRVDPSGSAGLTILNAQGVGDTTHATTEAGFGVAVLPSSGEVLVAGVTNGAFSFGDSSVVAGTKIFIGRLTATLAPKAAATASAGPNSRAWSVAVAPQETAIVVTGNFYGTADFGGTSATAQGAADLFVWKLTPP